VKKSLKKNTEEFIKLLQPAGANGFQPSNSIRSRAVLCLLESSVFCIEQCYVGLFSPATFNNHLDGQSLFG
jgi:hypothetical protein